MRCCTYFTKLCSALMLFSACKQDRENQQPTPQPAAPAITVTDVDGNIYRAVAIGDQAWMAQNLRTTRYSDSTTIAHVTDDRAWTQLGAGAWCNYDNEPANEAIYGKLYNWYAAANPKICPQGWHIPTDAEWQQLELVLGMAADEVNATDYRGGVQQVGGKMKATTLWQSPNTGATNESGFSGLAGGFRSSLDGSFDLLGFNGYWWSASKSVADSAWGRYLNFGGAGVGKYDFDERDALCLRCVRD